MMLQVFGDLVDIHKGPIRILFDGRLFVALDPQLHLRHLALLFGLTPRLSRV
ncbi:MAG: hypothetical protein P4M11_14175 [Candidatus Pacebacteria bacterium]|nr:hypothetical protein [Candidatus Paceibacterota bacterium]